MPPRVRINDQEATYLDDLIGWSKLSADHKALLHSIVVFCRADTRPARPSLEELAGSVSRSVAFTWRKVDELEAMDLLHVERACGPGQRKPRPVRYDYNRAALEAYPRHDFPDEQPPDPTYAKYNLGEGGLADGPFTWQPGDDDIPEWSASRSRAQADSE